MSRLGWHFTFIGTFAMLGGAVRASNLPLVLAGLVVGTLLMQWRLSHRTIAAIDSRRRLPDEAFVGQPFSIRFLVTNRSDWLPAMLLRFDDFIVEPGESRLENTSSETNRSKRSWGRMFAALFQPNASRAMASCGVGQVTPRRTVEAKYDCLVTKRGRYDFGPSVVSTGMPLGLLLVKKSISDRQSIYVFPQLLGLRRDWRRHLQTRGGGMATTARRTGASDGDFFGLRSWQAGDSRRWIHWRTTARIGEPAVRQFEQQRRFDVCVLVDVFCPIESVLSESTQASAAGDDAVELAISAAATLITQIVPTPTNRVALAVSGTKNSVIINGGNRQQLNAMLRILADVTPSTFPDLVDAVEQVFRTIGQPQDLVVISPRTVPSSAERLVKTLSGRCSLRWYSVADGSIDLLVERPKSFGYPDPTSDTILT